MAVGVLQKETNGVGQKTVLKGLLRSNNVPALGRVSAAQVAGIVGSIVVVGIAAAVMVDVLKNALRKDRKRG